MRTLFLALVILLLGPVTAFTAETKCNPAKVEEMIKSTPLIVGADYEPMSWWKSFQISNSYYMNPEALKKLSYAYLFDPSQITDDQELVQIFDWATAGKVLLAVSTDKAVGIGHGVKLVSLDDPYFKTKAGITDPTSFKGYLDNNNIYIAWSDNEICGSAAKAVFLKADTTTGK